MPAPRPRPISDFLPRFQNVAQTSQYLVKFALPYSRDSSGLRSYLRRKGVNDRFVVEDAGLLCSDAVLPGSALASLDTRGDYQGVIERMAHTRNFTQINLEFYVDNEYKSMKFLEHWMEYITGAISNPADDAYFYQLHYPSEYKSNDTRIVKFERNYKQFLEYRFIGLFPLLNTSLNALFKSLARDDDSPHMYRSKLKDADAFNTCDPLYETLVELRARGNNPINLYSKNCL